MAMTTKEKILSLLIYHEDYNIHINIDENNFITNKFYHKMGELGFFYSEGVNILNSILKNTEKNET